MFNFVQLLHLMYRHVFLYIIFCCCFAVKAIAQQTYTINGIIYNRNTKSTIQQALVTNLRTRQMMISDELGSFHIAATNGDTLLIKKDNFGPQKLAIMGDYPINIYLQPAVLLNEVAIKEQTKKQELDEVMDQYKSVGGYYTLTPSLWSMINSPLTGLYEYLGAEPNRARKFKQYSIEETEHIEVNKRYTPALIKQVTGVTDDKEIHDFMLAFTPSYEDLKTWNDYDMIKYIKKSYAYYKNNKGVFKLQRLN